MNPKVQSFAELATTTSKQLTSSYTEWTNFLRVAGRLYKYPYHELLLIYAQRPEATACASFDIWNKHMNRAVRRGSKGIALMDTSSGEPKLRYVFDISDTVGRDKSRRPFLWQYRDEHSEVVTASLAEHFGVDDEHDLPYQLDVIADDLAAAYWDDYREDILASVPDSYLEELDEFNIEVAFRNAAGASTAYVLLSRCGLDPEDYFSHEDFMSVFVHVFRYVTEATFDAYLYQTVEKKQQFIGQIMTSKSPVRSCEDVDEAALSYAEVKALCAGDPRIKERMELDVDVAKLQMIQANYRSQQYELEDKIRLFFPQERQRLEWRIEGIQQDINTLEIGRAHV